MTRVLIFLALAGTLSSQEIDWTKVEAETLKHFSALIQINSSESEKKVVDYIKGVLDKEGIESKIFTMENFADPTVLRPNLVARIRGNGKKKPILIVGHTDTVGVDAKKWTHGPFSAHREGGHIYGRGTLDDKDNLVAAMMSMILLKRQKVALDRDVIFMAEAGEEGSPVVGVAYLVREHWPEIEAEYCLAEAGEAVRTDGKLRFVSIETTEKLPLTVRLVASGTAGHGSAPTRSNAVVHIAKAVGKAADWMPPMRMNDTTRTYFERLATVSTPEKRERYNGLFDPDKTDAIQEYLAVNEPFLNSMLRSSISPNIIKAGFRRNVIPSEAEATLDIRVLPDEDIPKFLDMLRSVINDPTVKVVRDMSYVRPGAAPSSLNNEAFKTIEAMAKKYYEGVAVLPLMQTGATDMSFLRAKGMQCYGIGPMIDSEDMLKGFGPHSDQERILESALFTFVRFHYDLVEEMSRAR